MMINWWSAARSELLQPIDDAFQRVEMAEASESSVTLSPVHLLPLTPSLGQAGGFQRMVFQGHTDAVVGVCIYDVMVKHFKCMIHNTGTWTLQFGTKLIVALLHVSPQQYLCDVFVRELLYVVMHLAKSDALYCSELTLPENHTLRYSDPRRTSGRTSDRTSDHTSEQTSDQERYQSWCIIGFGCLVRQGSQNTIPSNEKAQ